MPTTEPAYLISLSSLEVSFLYMLPPPAHHSVEDAANHRLVKHPQQFAADVENLQSTQKVQPALCFPVQVAAVCCPVQFIIQPQPKVFV